MWDYRPEIQLDIRCRIVHTTFGAKPNYEALSYTWGTELSKRHIKMNGHRFHVSSNLFAALLHLGSSDVERTFWIDSICINQKDIDERNSQIQLMPFIYKRAETVVVWLGGHLDLDFDPRKSEYWKRLWVIQEIAKARKLNVSWAAVVDRKMSRYRIRSEGWDEFVSRFPCDDVHKLRRLRQERYSDSSLLRNLLNDHQGAQCKDPRDKIYGLVGMSTDCSGRLPIDYRKSLWEVYKDVIVAYHAYPEILKLSTLLKQLIGGPEQILARDIEGDKAPNHSLDLEPKNPTMVMIPCCFLGIISHVGPSYNDVIASPQKSNEWEAAIEQKVNKRKPGTREQSDIFLVALEDTDEEALNAKLSLNRKTSWPKQNGYSRRVQTFSNLESPE